MRGNVRSRDDSVPRATARAGRSLSGKSLRSAERKKSPSATRTSRVARSASSSAPRARVHARRGRAAARSKLVVDFSSKTPRNASNSARLQSRSRFKRSPATSTRRASAALAGEKEKGSRGKRRVSGFVVSRSSSVSVSRNKVARSGGVGASGSIRVSSRAAKRAAALSAAPSQCAAGRPRGVSHRSAETARRQGAVSRVSRKLGSELRGGSGSAPASAVSAASSHHAASALCAARVRNAAATHRARRRAAAGRRLHVEKHERSGFRTR